MYNTLNASATMTSITLVASPWLRPGFNIWLDPLGISRFYYINSIRHTGNSRGEVFTSLGLSYGRSEEEWVANYKKINPETAKSNPFTFKNHIKSEEYFVPASSDSLAVINPSNMGKKDFNTDPKGTYSTQKTSARYALRTAQNTCDTGIAVNAYETPYKDWYGKYFVRRNTEFLNRYDSEYNLYELLGMMKAVYKDDTSLANQVLNGEGLGPLNPIKDNNRAVSEIAKKAISHELDNVKTPEIITSRASKTKSLIEEAEIQLAGIS